MHHVISTRLYPAKPQDRCQYPSFPTCVHFSLLVSLLRLLGVSHMPAIYLSNSAALLGQEERGGSGRRVRDQL